jgi:predicted flap endonuclease-1-like 5' DNA nuclease
MLTVRNRGNEPVIVGEQYLFAGGQRQVADAVARSAVANNPQALVIVDDAPAPVDWTAVKGIGAQLDAALHSMGLNSAADVRRYVAANGADALLAVPGMHERRLAALLAFVEVQ